MTNEPLYRIEVSDSTTGEWFLADDQSHGLTRELAKQRWDYHLRVNEMNPSYMRVVREQ